MPCRMNCPKQAEKFFKSDKLRFIILPHATQEPASPHLLLYSVSSGLCMQSLLTSSSALATRAPVLSPLHLPPRIIQIGSRISVPCMSKAVMLWKALPFTSSHQPQTMHHLYHDECGEQGQLLLHDEWGADIVLLCYWPALTIFSWWMVMINCFLLSWTSTVVWTLKCACGRTFVPSYLITTDQARLAGYSVNSELCMWSKRQETVMCASCWWGEARKFSRWY